VTPFHRYLGAAIVGLFVVIFLWGLLLLALRREDAPTSLWAVQHWTENLLVLQVATGVVLLVMGRRVVGDPLVWLHYLYGSVFPLIALVGGRIAGLRRERREYLGLAWGAFFALGLTLRALQTGCGNDPRLLARCLGFET
jgi:hypothetical protein